MIPFQPKRASGHISNLVVSSAIDNQFFKTVLGIIFMVLMSFQSYGQDETWKLLKEESGIKVYYQIVKCDTPPDVSDPLNIDVSSIGHQTFQLKLVNDNVGDKSITFSKVTKTNDSDELQSITIGSGTTLLETCEASPKLILTKIEGDNFPIAVTDFLTAFTFTIND
tara:strand:+ start:1072 stop:1572 length:501 start_codon:yes stop_codon:yes gene_type:complete